MLEAALVEIQTEWWQIRAREMAEQEHHTAAMALMPRRIVASIQQLNACEAEQVTARAARDALHRFIPQDADNPDLVDTAMSVVQERLQVIVATEDQEKAIEHRTGQLAMASSIIDDLRASLDFNESEHFFHTMFCSADQDRLREDRANYEQETNRAQKDHEKHMAECAVPSEEWTAHMAALQSWVDAEEATKKRIADENAALEAEEAMFDELEATQAKIEKATQELAIARAAATAAKDTHNTVVASYYPLHVQAEADEEAAEQIVENNKRAITELTADLSRLDKQHAAERQALMEQHRDEMIALQNTLQNETAAKYNAIQEERAEMQRVAAKAKVESALKEEEQRELQEQVAAAMGRLEKTEDGTISWTVYTFKG